jgi:hypothetical protein
VNDETKSPLRSKTLWVNLVLAVTALCLPKVHQLLAASPETIDTLFMLGAALVNMFLRTKTTTAIALPPKQ